MSAPEFKINVVEREAYHTVGLKVRTTMAQAHPDAVKLWEKDFGPRMPEIQGFPTFSFGSSVMVDEEHFDYWATMPLPAGAPVPQGMSTLDLPAGLYAECQVPSLNELAAAYMFIYQGWLPASEYEYPAFNAASYELYPADHLQTGRLTLYMPVRRKSG